MVAPNGAGAGPVLGRRTRRVSPPVPEVEDSVILAQQLWHSAAIPFLMTQMDVEGAGPGASV